MFAFMGGVLQSCTVSDALNYDEMRAVVEKYLLELDADSCYSVNIFNMTVSTDELFCGPVNARSCTR